MEGCIVQCVEIACLQMSIFCRFVSLLERYQCFHASRGCVPHNRPMECIKKYCPLGSISQYTPKGAGIVFVYMISEENAIQYHPCCQ